MKRKEYSAEPGELIKLNKIFLYQLGPNDLPISAKGIQVSDYALYLSSSYFDHYYEFNNKSTGSMDKNQIAIGDANYNIISIPNVAYKGLYFLYNGKKMMYWQYA